MKKNSFPATVIIVILFFGAIFLLSGLCTGFFALEAKFGDAGAYYTPSHWYEALFIGSFALLPSGLMLWAAIRQIRRGNNKVSGVIFFIAGGLVTLYGLLAVGSNAVTLLQQVVSGADNRYGPSVLTNVKFLIVTLLMLAAGIWLFIVALKILRKNKPREVNPETFD